MINSHRMNQFKLYSNARNYFIDNCASLIQLEKYISDHIYCIIEKNISEFEQDYNEASYLFPFWQNYPPDNRGRMPKGDQFPWLEVGEHVFCQKLSRLLSKSFSIRDCGIPTGPDERFVISSDEISEICDNLTNSCWVFIDIKSVGPRDDQEHAVMSHNQISGNGLWNTCDEGVINDIIQARGKQTSHPFYCAIPPIYILSDGTILPVVHIVIKPVYKMLNMGNNNEEGQPLNKVTQISIPNGLLLFENPGYLNQFPRLFFPGKDDKSKNKLKMRARISFEALQKIDDWRVKTLFVSGI